MSTARQMCYASISAHICRLTGALLLPSSLWRFTSEASTRPYSVRSRPLRFTISCSSTA